ncbi:unnamed protein product, partial [Closterium sp. NIES-54]
MHLTDTRLSAPHARSPRLRISRAPILAASPLRASSQAADAASSKAASEDDQVIGTRMTINGRSLTFNALRCAAIPAGKTRRVQVSWQKEGEADCTAIQFFKSPKCTGKAVDTVAQGKQRSKPLRRAVTSARCIIGTTNTKALDGKTKAAGGKTKAADGKTKAADSNTKAADSNTKAADSNTKAADSNTKAAGGNTKAADGNTKAADGNTKAADGNTKAADGNTKAADGNTKAADGNTKAADGNTKPPGSKIKAPSEYPDAESSSTGVCGFDRVNGCLVGTCIDRGTEDRTCVCLPNHRSHGHYCDQDWEPISSITVAGSDWRCKDVYSMYGLTLEQFTHMNPGIDCSALLPQGRELVVKELLPECSAFYYVQPADTCSSVAQFLDITEKSLQQLNPGVSCSSRLLAFRALCVERNPAKARPTCEKEIQIGQAVDFKQVAASNGATMVDLCRLNPWISFRDSARDIDGLCVAARYATPPPSDDTTPPSHDTTPPPSDDTTPPPSDDTTPPPSDDTTPPPSDDTTPPPSDDTTPPPSDDTTPPPSDNTTPPSEYPDEESSSTGVCGYDRVNGCLVGTCIDRGTEDSTCVCLPNHRSHGSYCDQDWEAISSITVAGSDWRCKDVYSMYGLTLEQFTHMNPGIDCSALLPQGRELMVKELLPECSAFYYVQPADTCSSVAQFLDITEKSLQQLNPSVSCSSRLLAFRALCVERNPAKARPTCEKEIQIGQAVDFKQVAASNGATMVDLCRLNPWISFRDSARDIDGLCVAARYATPPPSDDTTPPPSDDTTPPPSDDTTPPPSDNTTPPSEYPDKESSSTGACGFDRVNGCLVGTCIDRGTEDRTCVCLPNHRSHGRYCDQDWEAISSITVAGSDWRCKDVYSMYGLTLEQFTHMNPGIDCSGLLPQGRELVVKELLPECSAFYYVQPADTCSSVAQFLDVTEKSLQQLNPGVSCSSRLLAFRALCVERNKAKTKPRCVKEIQIGRVVDFKQVAASNGATMVDLCRLNPWISFRDSARDIDGQRCSSSSLPFPAPRPPIVSSLPLLCLLFSAPCVFHPPAGVCGYDRVNGCLVGTCIDRGTEDFTCVCLPNHRSHGSYCGELSWPLLLCALMATTVVRSHGYNCGALSWLQLWCALMVTNNCGALSWLELSCALMATTVVPSHGYKQLWCPLMVTNNCGALSCLQLWCALMVTNNIGTLACCHRRCSRVVSSTNWEAISSITVAGSDWRCKDVYSVYGLTLQQFTTMNPGIDCSALLPQGRELVVKELLPACTAFYYTQPADTCSSVAQFLSITEESLQQLNPGVSCSSRLLAFRALCVERNPAKAKPRCVKEIQIGQVVDFKQVAASHGATMVDLCRLNPWISFRDSLRDIDG